MACWNGQNSVNIVRGKGREGGGGVYREREKKGIIVRGCKKGALSLLRGLQNWLGLTLSTSLDRFVYLPSQCRSVFDRSPWMLTSYAPSAAQ